MIRAASEHDLPAMAELVARRYSAEQQAGATPERMAAIGREVIARGLAVLVLELGQLVGCAGLVRDQWRHNDEPYLTDAWFCAEGAVAFGELLTACRMVARRVRLPLVLGGFDPVTAELKARLYRMHGGRIVGFLAAFD